MTLIILCRKATILLLMSAFVSCAVKPSEPPAVKYGMLSVKGTQIVDKNGNPVQLKGVSLFWSQWGSKYWNEDAISYIVSNWHVNVIRAAMGVDSGGYLENKEAEKAKVINAVNIAVKLGIYVIIDWHDHQASRHTNEAAAFFREMSEMYKDTPNVMYEPWNEPLMNDKWKDVKEYSEGIIKIIRSSGARNIIMVGSPSWSRDVDSASLDPITNYNNIAYTFHFYAGDHKQGVRDKAEFAIGRGLALFVSEWGTCLASGNGGFNPQESDLWIKFMDKYNLSWCNWSLNDKDETASMLAGGADPHGGWTDKDLTDSGKYVRARLLQGRQ
jgi:endoglucanase